MSQIVRQANVVWPVNDLYIIICITRSTKTQISEDNEFKMLHFCLVKFHLIQPLIGKKEAHKSKENLKSSNKDIARATKDGKIVEDGDSNKQNVHKKEDTTPAKSSNERKTKASPLEKSGSDNSPASVPNRDRRDSEKSAARQRRDSEKALAIEEVRNMMETADDTQKRKGGTCSFLFL